MLVGILSQLIRRIVSASISPCYHAEGAHLHDLLLVQLALLRELPELAHVLEEQLRNALPRERVSRLRLECIP